MAASIEEYGQLFREAFSTLHGGQPEMQVERETGETLEQYLARSRDAALAGLLSRLQAATPPPDLADLHSLIVGVLRGAIATDEALAAQVRAYGCNDFQESMAHSERVGDLVAESARLDRDLMITLQQLDSGTLEALGLATEPADDEEE
ncbi:MAG TPA: hypothetical protein VFB90_08430 [Dehalococcoidia bacterium]|nr:hypothetical protein [Dehalococcoidia bacterium]